MAKVGPAFRLKHTTNTTGTGTLTLNASAVEFNSFFGQYGAARRVFYCVSGQSQFEVGIGVYDGNNPGVLSRETVINSSSGTSLVSLNAGTKDVFVHYIPGQFDYDEFSANKTATIAEMGRILRFTGASGVTLTLPLAASLPAGAQITVLNHASSPTFLAISRAGAETIDGSTSIYLGWREGATLVSTGTAWAVSNGRPATKLIGKTEAPAGTSGVVFTWDTNIRFVELTWAGAAISSSTDLILRCLTAGIADIGATDYWNPLEFWVDGTAPASLPGAGISYIPMLSTNVLAGDARIRGHAKIYTGSATTAFTADVFTSFVRATGPANCWVRVSGQRSGNGYKNGLFIGPGAGTFQGSFRCTGME